MTVVTPFGWEEMSDIERNEYVVRLGDCLLEHKYRYYIKDAPLISDFEYDYVERTYEYICKLLNLEPKVSNIVGWDYDFPGAQEAMERVTHRKKLKDLNEKSK